jgi:hypothetical protein
MKCFNIILFLIFKIHNLAISFINFLINKVDIVDFLFVDDVLFDKNEGVRSVRRRKIGIFLFLMMSNWPYRLKTLYLSLKYLIQGNPDNFFSQCDSDSLEKVTRLNRPTFELIYIQFKVFWQKSFLSNI